MTRPRQNWQTPVGVYLIITAILAQAISYWPRTAVALDVLVALATLVYLYAPGLRVQPVAYWWDIGIGVFLISGMQRLYIFPVPCLGLRIDWGSPANRTHTCPEEDL